MPNALRSMAPPAPPDNAMQNQPQAAAPMGQASALQGQQAAPQPVPAPTHQQTVAALRHFGAIERELTTLLRNPDVGKTDMRSQIIDGTTSLVASRIIKPAEAVMQLGSVPDRPYDQRKWLETHLAQTVQAQNIVLDHHRMAFSGQDVDSTSPNPDAHADMMGSLMSQYKPAQNA